MAVEGYIASFAVSPDGMIVLAAPEPLPPVLDLLIVGGGPFGTAAAFRAKELGLKALVVDYDDLMKRIRDYPKDKLILPDFGGGDAMEFPKGGPLVSRLHFGPIDKDDLCATWKGYYRDFNVPAQIGVEMTDVERQGNEWSVICWNHTTKKEQRYSAKHVVLAVGRGVPRRLEVTGDVAGLAFNLGDATAKVGQPACVIGGGTSAAEAVIAISNAKAEAGDASAVYWSYRGDRLPKVSKALSTVFFDAFMGNGNIRYLAKSEPLAILGSGDDAQLSIRTERKEVAGEPAMTTHLEFLKRQVICCIGEDIPEALLKRLGLPLVSGGPSNKKRIAVTPILETRQPDIYLAGEVLSPVYFETTDFDGDPGAFSEVMRRGNIKAAIRDGVLVAEAVAQKLRGITDIRVVVEFETPAKAATTPVEPTLPVPPLPPIPPLSDSTPAATEPASEVRLVSILPSGVEADEYPVARTGITTLGRQGTVVTFPDDDMLADHQASLFYADGWRVRDEGSTRGTFLQPPTGRVVELPIGAVIGVGAQWLVAGDSRDPTALLHYSDGAKLLARLTVTDGISVLGRESPDITIAPNDSTLSRRHLGVIKKNGRLAVKDIGSANGTLIKIGSPMAIADGDRLIIGRQVLRFTDETAAVRPKSVVRVDTNPGGKKLAELLNPVSQGNPAAPANDKRAVPDVPQPTPAPPGSAPAPAVPGPTLPAANRPSVVLAGRPAVPCRDTILDAVKSANILKWQCEQGTCGLDPIRICSGAEFLNPISETEEGTLEDFCKKKPGEYRLACMARTKGPVVIEPVQK